MCNILKCTYSTWFSSLFTYSFDLIPFNNLFIIFRYFNKYIAPWCPITTNLRPIDVPLSWVNSVSIIDLTESREYIKN